MSSKSLILSGLILVILLIFVMIYFLFFNKNENLVKINEAKIDNDVDYKILDSIYKFYNVNLISETVNNLLTYVKCLFTLYKIDRDRSVYSWFRNRVLVTT